MSSNINFSSLENSKDFINSIYNKYTPLFSQNKLELGDLNRFFLDYLQLVRFNLYNFNAIDIDLNINVINFIRHLTDFYHLIYPVQIDVNFIKKIEDIFNELQYAIRLEWNNSYHINEYLKFFYCLNFLYIIKFIEKKQDLYSLKSWYVKFLLSNYVKNLLNSTIDEIIKKHFCLILDLSTVSKIYAQSLETNYKEFDELKLKNNLQFYIFLIYIYKENNQLISFYQIFKELFNYFLKSKKDEEILTLYIYIKFSYLPYIHTSEQSIDFIYSVEKTLSDYIVTDIIPKYNIKPVKKQKAKKSKKIAFFVDRLIPTSPVKLLYSLLEILTSETDGSNEYYLINLGVPEFGGITEKDLADMFRSLPINYINMLEYLRIDPFDSVYNRLEKCMKVREYVINEGIDVIVVFNNILETDFLIATRSAPKQIYWSHINTLYNFHGIDKRITHCAIAETEFTFEQFSIPQSEVFFKADLDECKNKAEEIRKRFPADTVILGSIGRLIKLEGEGYLDTVAEIMKQNENTVYLACGGGAKEHIQKKIKELGIADRFYFEGWVATKIYAYIIDVYLNTFPNPSGEAFAEFFRMNDIALYVDFVQNNSKNYTEYIKNAIFLIELKNKYKNNYPEELNEVLKKYEFKKFYNLTHAIKKEIKSNFLNTIILL